MQQDKTERTQRLLDEVIHQAEEIKAEDIVILDLRGIESAVCDFFVICSGGSSTHVNAIAGKIEREVSRTQKEHPWHVEGAENSQWVLIDYYDVVIHVFQKQQREYYDLEGMWADAPGRVIA